jgi:hypothetical protein
MKIIKKVKDPNARFKNELEEIVVRIDKVIKSPTIYPLNKIPSGRSYSDRKNEENYAETEFDKMHRSSKKPGTLSQYVFCRTLEDKYGVEMLGVLWNKKSKGATKTFFGSAEHIREQAYNFFMRLSDTPNKRKDWELIVYDADINPNFEEFIG